MGALFTGSMIKRLLLIAVIIGGLGYWINWSFDVHAENTRQKNTIEERNQTIADLRKKIDDFVSIGNRQDKEFESIDESQIDLLCAARGYADVITPLTMQKPTIVEVVKWRERKAQCPADDNADSNDTPSPPAVSEEIAMQSLNNSWKAYCITVNNEDDICIPFRQ